MKVWFPVIKGGSGTDIFTRRLADALRRHGIAAEVTYFPTRYEFAPFLLRSIPPPPGVQIVHANSWSGFAFKRSGLPLVVTEHLNVLDPYYRPHKSLIQHLYHKTMIRSFVTASFQLASAITVVSRFTAAGLVRALGIRTAQVIHNWIDTEAFSPLKQNSHRGEQSFRLLFVGNLSKRKGADMLAPIMKELGPKFELHFTSGLRDLKIREVSQNMVPLGRLTEERELIEAYRQSDVLLFPSRFEGFGYVALEAMACGIPVIATNTSSLPEIVEDAATGILCPVNDIQAFLSACRKLAADPETLRQYGEAGRRRAEKCFSKEVVIPQYVALYEKLANGRGHFLPEP